MVNIPKIPRSEASDTGEDRYRTKLPDRKITWVAYLLLLLGGGGIFGFHRFYLGFYRSAKTQLCLGIGALLSPFLLRGTFIDDVFFFAAMSWYLVDLFLIPGMVKSANSRFES